jgi:hypothetical protein
MSGAAVRDLEKDLEICEAATPGPWIANNTARHEDNLVWGPKGPGHGAVAQVSFYTPSEYQMNDVRFIAEAREGWPYAIKQAIEAEEKVDKLIHEMGMLQDELNRRGCGV